MKNTNKTKLNDELEESLLAWYDAHQRDLPWRALPGNVPNPYHVWLSEIMLQQTTVATVIDYFYRFIHRWPRLDNLATASLDEVFHCWQGLGYYSRARNLHRCAQVLMTEFHGLIPAQESLLLTLPGVGPYTAAAIASIAFDVPTVPVDGNIIRVFSRLFAIETPLPALKTQIQQLVKDLVPSKRSGDFAQSLMDLGATICKPRQPLCDQCPWSFACESHKLGITDQLPRPAPKGIKPTRRGVVFWLENHRGEILIEKRPEKGLLAGMIGFPSTPWVEETWQTEPALAYAPKGGKEWKSVPQRVRHTFTHFHLELSIVKGIMTGESDGIWSTPDNFKTHALPTVMKKVSNHVKSQGA